MSDLFLWEFLTDLAADQKIGIRAEDPVTTTLLAVDDSKTMRKVLEITFAGEDYRTVLARSGAEAMQQLAAAKPALVLIDHTLEDSSGYELCQKIKGSAPGTRVIILSSKQNPYDKARGASVGADDFMDKPFDTQKLLDKVSAVMAQPAAAVQAAPAVAAAPAAAMPRPPAAAAAPARPAPISPMGSMASRPRPVGGAAAPVGTPAAQTPRPADAASPRPAPAAAKPMMPVGGRSVGPAKPAPAAPAPAPAPIAAAAPAAAAAIAAGNGQLAEKLSGLGLSPDQAQAVLALSREVVERVVWEVVPVLAEALIKEEIQRLTRE